eukprot:TRINITY_DN16646_c0_g1_i1.p1 TRINITY_DN16646_c0_g1~~TRINITY_DN16646_c0_g1_i1.p1  ORF type:complete len:349 (+),score=55.46 TRINITY_DN16646_c0_g1_i1:98-1048(+)
MDEHCGGKVISAFKRKSRRSDALRYARAVPQNHRGIYFYNTVLSLLGSPTHPDLLSLYPTTPPPQPDSFTYVILISNSVTEREATDHLKALQAHPHLSPSLAHYEALLKTLAKAEDCTNSNRASGIWGVADGLGDRYPVLGNFMLVFYRNKAQWRLLDDFYKDFPRESRNEITYNVVLDSYARRHASDCSPFMKEHYLSLAEEVLNEASARRRVQPLTFAKMMSFYVEPPSPTKAMDLLYRFFMSPAKDSFEVRKEFNKASGGAEVPKWVPKDIMSGRQQRDFQSMHKESPVKAWVQETRGKKFSVAFGRVLNYLY